MGILDGVVEAIGWEEDGNVEATDWAKDDVPHELGVI